MFDRATDTAFRRAIVAKPDDDAPRLIYADWLEEQGDTEFAEFIRLQIEFFRLPPRSPHRIALRARIADLQQPHHQEWIDRLPHFPKVTWEVFERGMVSVAKFETPDSYFEHAKYVFDAAPIREVRLHGFYWQDAVKLADSRALELVRVLDMNDGNRIGNAGVEALMRSEHLQGLTSIQLSRNSLGSTAARAIAESVYVNRLQTVRLDHNDLYDDGVRFLAQSPNLENLEVLDLDLTRTSDAGATAIARSRFLRKLQMLYLSRNQIGDDGAAALSASTTLTSLTDLFLHSNWIGDRGAIRIAQSENLASLERLFLRMNRMRDAGIQAFAESTTLTNLRELYVGGNSISDQTADRLRERFGNRVNVH